MSERTIKFIYKGEEKIVNIFANFEECKKAFQKEFDLSDIEMNKISLYYKDDEDENTLIDSNEDYNFFLDSDSSSIEGQEVKEDPEKPDPMRSASIFKKKINDSIKENNSFNLADSYSKENNQILGDSANFDLDLSKNNSKGTDFDDINKVDNLLSKVLQQQKEENMIAELKNQMDELKKKHEEEKKQIEEENKKKYNEALEPN